MKCLNDSHMLFVKAAHEHFNKTELTTKELKEIPVLYDVKSSGWLTRKEFRTGSGRYLLPLDGKLPESIKEQSGVEGTDGDYDISRYNNIIPLRKNGIIIN